MENLEEQNTAFVSFEDLASLDSYHDFTMPTTVPSLYDCWVEEATDVEIQKYIAQSPSFAFLTDPKENIYTIDDGEPVCL